jgi:hypothetical protein
VRLPDTVEHIPGAENPICGGASPIVEIVDTQTGGFIPETGHARVGVANDEDPDARRFPEVFPAIPTFACKTLHGFEFAV